MIPTREQIEAIACISQKNVDGTTNLEWRRARLGCFSSSEIGSLMSDSKAMREYKDLLEKKTVRLTKKDIAELMLKYQNITEQELIEKVYAERLAEAYAKAEAEPFTLTGLKYIYKVASERNMDEVFINDDMLFGQYMSRTELYNRAVLWGTETEPMARGEYIDRTGYEVSEVGFIRHSKIDWLGDSPDGLVTDNDGKIAGTIEIKCPMSHTWMEYKHAFAPVTAIDENGKQYTTDYLKAAAILKELEPDYYWQCMCHMDTNDVQWCDFMFYDQMQKQKLITVRILRNNDDIIAMHNRINKANELIDQILAE